MFTNSPWMKVLTNWQLLPLKIQIWHKRSLNFQNLTKSLPGEIFLDKSSFLVLGKSQVGNISPWVKIGKVTRLVPEVWRIDRIGPCELKNWKKSKQVLILFIFDQFNPYDDFWEFTISAPKRLA